MRCVKHNIQERVMYPAHRAKNLLRRLYAEAFDELVQEIKPGIFARKAYTITFL